ncbi:hypothetical protein DdX_12613 [Ditylenchus destructor]|uniref:Uncharacterized protein n=1 Tax=Ditylenchus destructor TaxID=166010 RepID=A0AAD4N0I9_9BILA|nr:hypothetical protein DdX_12613 [Ditylenchus destructor]
MCCPSDEFENENLVTAQTIECFVRTLGTCCAILVFFAAPIVTIILVFVRKISPWWLFLGWGPLVLMLCLNCCLVCARIIFENYVYYCNAGPRAKQVESTSIDVSV